MKEKKIKSSQYKCESCGGTLAYNPTSQDLTCKKCDTHYPIADGDSFSVHRLVDKTESKGEEYQEFINNNKVFKCESCGANVLLNQLEMTQVCPYCGSTLVIDKDSIPGLKPDCVLPFMFDEEEASNKFRADVKKRFFAPSKFKKNMPTSAIKGIYIPAFVFSGDSHSKYVGQLYNEYVETDRQGHSYTRRSYFMISGERDVKLNNITVESSSQMNQAEINSFLPYDYKDAKAYKDAYLLGYNVEHYVDSLDESKEKYRNIAKDIIERQILSKYSYDGVAYIKINSEFSNETYVYSLLPVYRFEYEYKKKKYITYMNAQTGKVDKNVPKSALKISLVVILGILALLVPILLAVFLS